VNKRTLENFIKSGALDTLAGTRKQKLLIAPELLDQRAKERKNTMEGQMTLFDIAGDEEKTRFQITFPEVGEFLKEDILAFEKETLGIYLSGHPMEAYEETWRNNITAVTNDFIVDEEVGAAKVSDGSYVTIGGMITSKTVKTTRNNKMMAFITLEDLLGSVEVIVFPKDYESKRELFVEESIVFIQGRVSIGDDPVGKLVCERVTPFSVLPKELWLKFPDKEAYVGIERELLESLKDSEGNDSVIIYLEKERAKKVLPSNRNVNANEELLRHLVGKLGEKNVKVMEKKLEKIGKMN
jgi:DNA polymerase-3 subunit alpha